MTHTFAICAYKDSKYLEQCILSVINQGSKVIICTSTPSEYIDNLARKYNLKVFAREGKSNIADDWNYAIESADTDLVTLTHQDDIYDSTYAKVMLSEITKCKNPIMFSSAYGELRNERKVISNKLLNIKKMLRVPMRVCPNIKAIRRLSISFGNSICCPSVTYVKEIMESHPFKHDFKSNLDWQMWEELSKLEGEFAYSNKVLMYHRIHEESETTNVIKNDGRKAEDIEMYRKFWPKKIAEILAKGYSCAEGSNKV